MSFFFIAYHILFPYYHNLAEKAPISNLLPEQFIITLDAKTPFALKNSCISLNFYPMPKDLPKYEAFVLHTREYNHAWVDSLLIPPQRR